MTDQPSEPPVKRETIILKELDHIQAIMARFYTFFFLMKQVSLAGVATLLAVAANNKFHAVSYFVSVVPLVFLTLEVSFRFCYWSRYVDRVETIRDYLQRNELPPVNDLYVLVRPFKSWKSYFNMRRWLRVVKFFDVLYYVIWALGIFLVLRFAWH